MATGVLISVPVSVEYLFPMPHVSHTIPDCLCIQKLRTRTRGCWIANPNSKSSNLYPACCLASSSAFRPFPLPHPTTPVSFKCFSDVDVEEEEGLEQQAGIQTTTACQTSQQCLRKPSVPSGPPRITIATLRRIISSLLWSVSWTWTITRLLMIRHRRPLLIISSLWRSISRTWWSIRTRMLWVRRSVGLVRRGAVVVA
jgi:hypothetical protein